MRGSPLFRAVLVLGALLLLLLPLLRLTRGACTSASANIPSAGPIAEKMKVQFELLSSRVPFHFELRHLGKTIWQGESTEPEVKKEIEMEFPSEGVDLELEGGWRDGEQSAAAVKLTVIPRDGLPRDKSIWAQKDFDEVLTFQ
jgi:hypothetical protein